MLEDWIQSRQSEFETDLIDLCSINSGSTNVEGLLAVSKWLCDWMQLPNTSPTITNLADYQSVSDQGELLELATGPILRWDVNPGAPKRMLLAIHYDTVFQADSPFQDCEALGAGRLRGPGVADAKGGIIVIRSAVLAALELGLLGEYGLTIVLNPDEELGSPASTQYFHEIAREFEFGLLFEPCLPNGNLIAERKGSGNFDIVVRGRSAHAGRHFDDGRNAVAALCRLFGKLDQLNGQRQGATINLGRVIGGGPVNIVPDLAVGRLNARVPDDITMQWLLESLREMTQELNAEDGLACELHGGITSPPKLKTHNQVNVMGRVERAASNLGQTITWQNTGGVCDGNKLAAAGLANIDTLGPLGDRLHSHEEWVLVPSISEKIKLVVEIIREFSTQPQP